MGRKGKYKKLNIWEFSIAIIILICISIYGYGNEKLKQNNQINTNEQQNIYETSQDNSLNSEQNVYDENNYEKNDLSTIPEYSGMPYVEINNNVPYFTEEDYKTEAFEKYSELDILGRSGVALKNI